MTALDRFVHVADASQSHREAHGCDTYPTGDGRLLGAVAAALRPFRILEVGCGLGYSTLWLAWGGQSASVETIERDPVHADLAERFFEEEDLASRIHILVGDSLEVLPTLTGPYDLIFCRHSPVPRRAAALSAVATG
jgi:predicted O-methyltransferase YrrM